MCLDHICLPGKFRMQVETEEDDLICVSRLKLTSRRGEASSCAASWCWRCAASSRPPSPRTGHRLSRSRCNYIIMNLPQIYGNTQIWRRCTDIFILHNIGHTGIRVSSYFIIYSQTFIINLNIETSQFCFCYVLDDDGWTS